MPVVVHWKTTLPTVFGWPAGEAGVPLRPFVAVVVAGETHAKLWLAGANVRVPSISPPSAVLYRPGGGLFTCFVTVTALLHNEVTRSFKVWLRSLKLEVSRSSVGKVAALTVVACWPRPRPSPAIARKLSRFSCWALICPTPRPRILTCCEPDTTV